MPDPLLSRGALARLAIVLAVAALLAAPRLSHAAEADGCGDLGSTQAIVTAWGGGMLASLPAEEVDALKAVETIGGAEPAWMVAADVLAAPIRGGEHAVVFVADGRACSLLIMTADAFAALGELGRSGLRIGRGT
jgi:hypothetical protein